MRAFMILVPNGYEHLKFHQFSETAVAMKQEVRSLISQKGVDWVELQVEIYEVEIPTDKGSLIALFNSEPGSWDLGNRIQPVREWTVTPRGAVRPFSNVGDSGADYQAGMAYASGYHD